MTRPAPLTLEEIEQALESLDGWRYEEGHLRRTFEFDDFAGAFDWMKRVAEVAEAEDHHPEWCNVYGRVNVALRTHDASAVTSYDVELARAMDRLASA